MPSWQGQTPAAQRRQSPEKGPLPPTLPSEIAPSTGSFPALQGGSGGVATSVGGQGPRMFTDQIWNASPGTVQPQQQQQQQLMHKQQHFQLQQPQQQQQQQFGWQGPPRQPQGPQIPFNHPFPGRPGMSSSTWQGVPSSSPPPSMAAASASRAMSPSVSGSQGHLPMTHPQQQFQQQYQQHEHDHEPYPRQGQRGNWGAVPSPPQQPQTKWSQGMLVSGVGAPPHPLPQAGPGLQRAKSSGGGSISMGPAGGGVAGAGAGIGEGLGWLNYSSSMGDSLDEWAMALGDALGTDPTVGYS